MARNPYAPRRDYNAIGLVIVVTLAVALAVVLALTAFRPGMSRAEEAAHAEALRQMDQADQAFQAKHAVAETERQRRL